MRILKYLFLLLLLSLVAASIFIATQKGEFTVERSQVVNSPRSLIYNYVNDTKNWSDWNSLAVEDTSIKITPSTNTVGKGSRISWEGKEGNGDLQTTSIKENTSISQKINFNDNSALLTMQFKDTIGGTKVTWKAKGEMGFVFKIVTAFDGGAYKIFEYLFEKSLANLDQKLDNEINTYNIKIDGLVNKTKLFYLAQTINSEISKVNKNSDIVFSKITKFCKDNKISINGKPFNIYHFYDSIKKVTRLSICIPIKDSIFISEGSDILSRTLPPFQAIKTTLTGDYSHDKKALAKTTNHFKSKNLIRSTQFSHIEIYNTSKNETKNPSKWVTEIYFPIKGIEQAKSLVYKTPIPKIVTPIVKQTTVTTVPIHSTKPEIIAPVVEVKN